MRKIIDGELAPIPEGKGECISVIVACYNIEQYIERCIRSIMQQTYKNLEILVVDDGSTDSSPAICDRLALEDDRIRVFHTENQGLGLARDYAMERAKGAFYAFVDGDDFVSPDIYMKMMAAYLEYDADIVVTSYMEVSEQEGWDIWNKRSAGSLSKGAVAERLISTHALMDRDELLYHLVSEPEDYPVRNCAWNKLYRRETAGELRFPKGYYEDIVYTTRLLAGLKRGVVLKDRLYYYIVDRKGSIMNQGVPSQIFTHQIPAYRERDRVLRQAGTDGLALIHEYMVYKKLLLLYTRERRSSDTDKKIKMEQLRSVIEESRQSFEDIYSLPESKKGDKLRNRLFLISPILYNIFMDLNDYVILPLRSKK
ncbi:glycosyltransferase family 2 protein [Butyrivibrio sp. MC2013]|uniref:glycosyltransferase family 2 protein n=1 Tax=Butyrivibrio sp. MC2013 TaxID=1280686 RepID=UPI0004015F11|nr:glycosyltransferase family 2 protein [Butyrivibrio sp. MC2013]